MDDIYLDEINSITENPVWAGDNSTSRIQSIRENQIYDLYDIGLEIEPSNNSTLDIKVSSPTIFNEHSSSAKITINSEDAANGLQRD